jgi:signal transduction histidine kinase
MERDSLVELRRPSPAWGAGALVSAVLALVMLVVGVAQALEARRPVGEGALFLEESEAAAEVLADDPSELALRGLRNDLRIEAVSLVDARGRISASTSPTFVGAPLASPLLSSFAERGAFAAVAAPLVAPLTLDGVVEWPAGAVVYDVIHPVAEGLSVLLTYDMGELLARRSAARGISAATIELLTLGGALAVGSVALWVGRARARRLYRELRLESEYLEREAASLRAVNVELEAARTTAEEAYALAEEKNRIRSEFVLMINHELRTPLTGVVTGAELLESEAGITDPMWRDVLEGVVTDGRRLKEMIDQLLAVARIENRALFFELVPTSMNEVVERLGVAMATDVQAPGCGDIVVRTDVTSLVGLVHSLADNARTHGASEVQVACHRRLPFEPMVRSGEPPAAAVWIAVADDGPGIDPAFLPRVFEKFEKNSRSSGTGLGLHIASKIVEALEGQLLVTTSPQGSTFAVGLPLVAEMAR